MTKHLKILTSIFVLALILMIITAGYIVPYQLRKQITNTIEGNCNSCEFTTEEIDLGLFPTRVVLDDVHFVGGDRKSTLIDSHIERLIFTISTRMLLNHVLKIKQLAVIKPNVIVTEGDQKGDHSPKNESKSAWDLEIDHINIDGGYFTYHRKHLEKTGTLQISDINGSVGEISSKEEKRDQPVIAKVTAILEQSGKIDLKISPNLFSKEIHVDVLLGLSKLNLAEINRYFEPDDGIKLKGVITQSEAKVSVRGKSLHSEVMVDYYGLGIKFSKTSDRSSLTAIITNLLAGVKPMKDRGRTANVNRNPDEPLVGFILRGMKEAALKVATD